MESKKSNVIKSKSSNSAITTNSRGVPPLPRGKKTRSHAEFLRKSPRLEKKRGVYVERRSTKLSVHVNDGKGPSSGSPKKVLKRDKKEFLNAVWAILSKCTTSTQHPDSSSPITVGVDEQQTSSRYITREKKVKRTKKMDIVDKALMKVEKMSSSKLDDPQQESNLKTIKPKYKSKILNQVLNDNDENLVILKRRNVDETSSVRSDSVRWSSECQCINVLEDKYVKFDSFHRSTSDYQGQEKKLQINEPTTLARNTKHKKDVKNENGLYDFFVDLLETVYDANEAKDEVDESRVNFEIDEKVAAKLKIPKEDTDYNNKEENYEEIKMLSIPSPTPNIARYRSPTRSHMRSATVSRNRSPTSFQSNLTRSLKSRSPARSRRPYDKKNMFAYAEEYMNTSPKTSVASPKRGIKSKKTLLNILKEQLMMNDNNIYEEPQTIYEALKVMARNKRRCAKVIQFDETPRYTKADQPKSECWKRRRVISSCGKSTKPRKDRITSKSFNTSTIFRSMADSSTCSSSKMLTSKSSFSVISPKGRSIPDDYESDSFHSIEVEDFDVEPYPFKKVNQKDIFYTEPYCPTPKPKNPLVSPPPVRVEPAQPKGLDVNDNNFFLDATSEMLLDETLRSSDSYLFKSLNKFLLGH